MGREIYPFFVLEKSGFYLAAMNPRTCLVCEQELRGRLDKKFCDDACRNHYHNAKNRSSFRLFRQVHSKLKQNYRILSTWPDHEKVTKQELQKQGFDFHHITGIETRKNGKNCFFCYDKGYAVLNEQIIEIVSKE